MWYLAIPESVQSSFLDLYSGIAEDDMELPEREPWAIVCKQLPYLLCKLSNPKFLCVSY